MDQIKILIATHKASKFPNSKIFLPIHVGKEKTEMDFGVQGDNTGDNISYKNHQYCELTGLYWAWKNLKDVEYIGLCHYRRYFKIAKLNISVVLKNFLRKTLLPFYSIFFPKKEFRLLYGNTYICVNELDAYANSFSSEIESVIKKEKVDIFRMVDQEWYNRTVEERALRVGFYYIDQLRKILKDDFNTYYGIFENVLSSGKMQCGNMHIMKKCYFDEYCTFLFSVLDKHECLNEGTGVGYNRIPGFLAELLTTVFILSKEETCIVKKMDFVAIKDYHS